jgi:hypothetical protein
MIGVVLDTGRAPDSPSRGGRSHTGGGIVGIRIDWTLFGMISRMDVGVIDVWMQHPTLRHS